MGRKLRRRTSEKSSEDASDVKARKMEVPANIRGRICLEASNQQLKTLFRLRDQAESIAQLPPSQGFGHIVLLASEFYKDAGLPESWQTLIPDEDLPLEEELHMAEIRPVAINMFLNAGTFSEVEGNLSEILHHFRRFDDRVNVFWVLDELFRFALSRRKEFTTFCDIPDEREAEEVTSEVPCRCEICGDVTDVEDMYCGAVCCGKCIRFFQGVVRQKTFFSLRCARDGRCLKNRDISCSKCRADKCRKAGMLEEYYYTEMQHPSSKVCTVCNVKTDLLKVVRGLLLCSKCEGFFDQAVELNQKAVRTRDLWAEAKQFALVNVHRCLEDPDKCLVGRNGSCCSSCLWEKMVKLGLADTYLYKYQGYRKFSPSNDDDESCAVCDQPADDSLWMGQIVCRPCRSFLQLGMRLDSFWKYCCPNGERGRLCPILDSGSVGENDAASGGTVLLRCKYCWFRRLEIEGLVDSWLICGGQPELWSQFDLNCGSDVGCDDEEEEEKEKEEEEEDDEEEEEDKEEDGEASADDNKGVGEEPMSQPKSNDSEEGSDDELHLFLKDD